MTPLLLVTIYSRVRKRLLVIIFNIFSRDVWHRETRCVYVCTCVWNIDFFLLVILISILSIIRFNCSIYSYGLYLPLNMSIYNYILKLQVCHWQIVPVPILVPALSDSQRPSPQERSLEFAHEFSQVTWNLLNGKIDYQIESRSLPLSLQ